MSVFVKGMNMPESCGNCVLRGYKAEDGDMCNINSKITTELRKRPGGCPLCEVKPNHGDLIDINETYTINIKLNGKECHAQVIAPVVIEAENET